jgi:hypothetical protein
MNELFWFVAILMFLVLLWILFLEMVRPPPQVGIVRGTLTYGDSTLISGVLVTLLQSGVTVASVLSGTSGEFEFDPMALGVYDISAHKDLPDGWLEYPPTEIEITGPELSLGELPLVKRISIIFTSLF